MSHRLAIAVLATLFPFSGPIDAHADLRVFRVKNALFLEGESCEVLSKQANALDAWTRRMEEASYRSIKCIPGRTRGTYQIQIDGIVPSFVRNHANTIPPNDGPNCFNTTLVAPKILEHMRYSSSEELAWYLDSVLCKKVNESEMQPGDPVVVFNHPILAPSSTVISHSYVYLTPNLSFQKTGYMGKIAPFEFSNPQQISKEYEVTQSSSCNWITHSPPRKCKTWTVGYRCMSMDNYLSKGAESTTWIDTRNRLLSTSCFLGNWVFQDSHIAQLPLYELTTQSLNVVRKLIQAELAKIKGNDPEASRQRFLWQSLEYQVRGIYKQIEFNSYGIFSDPNGTN